jgi:hypothetical protein
MTFIMIDHESTSSSFILHASWLEYLKTKALADSSDPISTSAPFLSLYSHCDDIGGRMVAAYCQTTPQSLIQLHP